MADHNEVDKNLMRQDIDNVGSVLEWSPDHIESMLFPVKSIRRAVDAGKYFAAQSRDAELARQTLQDRLSDEGAAKLSLAAQVESLAAERDSLADESEKLHKQLIDKDKRLDRFKSLFESVEGLLGALDNVASADGELPWAEELDAVERAHLGIDEEVDFEPHNEDCDRC